MTPETWPAGSPFLGIVGRPYDQDLLAGIAWDDVDPERVWFRSLWLTQHHLSIPALVGLGKYSTDPHPRVVRCEGLLYLEDGHHRAVMCAMRKIGSMRARIISLPARVPATVGTPL